MLGISERTKKLVWFGSIAAGTAIIAIAFTLGYQGKTLDELILLAVMVAAFPPSIANYMDYRWKKSMDERLPILFRTIVQAQRTGMTLPQAIEEALSLIHI